MSTQPVLLVIGIAIAVNLVIMVALVAMLFARRSRLATADGSAQPVPSYAMADGQPTYTGPVSYIDEEPAEPPEPYDEDILSTTDSTDTRRFRSPDMSEPDDRVEATITNFFTGGSIGNGGGAVAGAGGAPAGAGGASAGTGARTEVTITPHPLAVSDRDELTGLDGPTIWDLRIRDEDARLARYRRPVSVVLFELDGLDRLVGRFGESAVDRIIPPVGTSISRQARSTDHVARIGEGRFAALLPETDEVQAINFVERVRAECDRWLAAGAVSMRLAIGWASPVPGSELKTALRLAEDRLNRDRRRATAG